MAALSSLAISWFQIFHARTFNDIEIGTWLRDFHKYLLDSALPWKLNGHILWVQTLWENEAYFGSSTDGRADTIHWIEVDWEIISDWKKVPCCWDMLMLGPAIGFTEKL